MRISISVYLLLLFIACNPQEQDDLGVTKIDVSKAAKSEKSLYEYTDELELIPLEYNGYNSLIGSLLKMELSDEKFFILSVDASENKFIHSFSLNGNFNSKLPDFDEYGLTSENLKDFAMLGNDTLLLVNDKKIFYVDSDFNLIKHESLKLNVEHIFAEGGVIYFHTNRLANNFQDSTLMYEVVVMDRTLNPIRKLWEFDIEKYSTISRSFLYGSITNANKGIFYTKFLNDTIYYIDGKNLEPTFFIDFDDKAFDSQKFPEAEISASSPILKDGFRWGVINPIVFDDYLYFRFRENGIFKAAFYSFKNNDTKILHPKNSIYNEELVPFPHYYKDGYFYSIINEYSLSTLGNYNAYGHLSTIRKAGEHLEKYHNPVLYRFKIRFND